MRASLLPRSDRLEVRQLAMMRVGIEQDALDASRKFGRQQNFRQIVNKDITSLTADALELFRDCQIEEYVLGRDQRPAVRVKHLPDPLACTAVQIVFHPEVGMARLVADDAQLVTGTAGPAHEVYRAGIRHRVAHARAVDVALHFGPYLFLAGAAQKIAHGELAARQVDGNMAAFARDQMEDKIVVDDRIVEIETDAHCKMFRRLSGSRGQRPLDACDDHLRRQAEPSASIVLRAYLVQKAIGQGEAEKLGTLSLLCREPFRDRTRQATNAAVFLDCRNDAILFEQLG